MDFFARQEQARRNTKWLVVYFALGVAALIAAVYVAVLLLWSGAALTSHHHRYQFLEQPEFTWWHPQLLLGVSVCTLAVIGIGSVFKTLELSRGGIAVADMLGGRLINPNTNNPDERKLLNVVEEMAIAAGLPVPPVYVLPGEQAINAFAAGHSSSDAVVAVTQGCLKLLTRDELQGVIGHEFSHILNGDMSLNLRLMGVIFGILCLAVVGRVLLQARSSNSRDRNPLPVLGLALLVIGWTGVFFGRLIQAGVSRQREFLADASSVQFTRNPAGLAGALKKIGGLSYSSKLEAAHADEACHMFFANGVGESFLHLMDTHPSLSARIKAIEPGFDGTFPQVMLPQETVAPSLPRAPAQRPGFGFPFPAPIGRAALASGLNAAPSFDANVVIPRLGNPLPKHIHYAEELRSAIQAAIQNASREPFGATTLIYALLFSEDQAARKKQIDELTRIASTGIVQETVRIWPEVQALATHAKLPLVDLALPALRHLSPTQFKEFQSAVQALVDSDGEIDLFEYVLQKIVLRHLEPQFVQARKPITQFYALAPLAGDCAVLLSALAYVGQDEPEGVQAAFEQGAQVLAYAIRAPLSLVSAEACDLSEVDRALDRLCQAVPQIKKNVLNACAQTVAADGVIRELEAELLRAIADTLDCPMPPFIPEQTSNVALEEVARQ